MEQICEKNYIDNGVLLSSGNYKEFDGSYGIVIYEVMRVISSVPLFLEDHLVRLNYSAVKSGFQSLIKIESIGAGIRRLIFENGVDVGNIKIVVGEWQGTVSWQAFFIPFHYPSESDYRNGVELGVLKAERKNPEAKTIQPEVRERANQMLESGGLYEVLLIDTEGFVREGSRSNIFFIKDDIILTPPASQVLNGITRQKVVDILHRYGYSFREEPIPSTNLSTFDAAFLTGTSPKVLPVQKIAGVHYNVQNPLCLEVMKKYDEALEQYILNHQH